MKTLFFIFLLLMPAISHATDFHFEWEYKPVSDLAGFRFYDDKMNLICETSDPNARAFDCTKDLAIIPGKVFATAYDTNGGESPPAVYDPPPPAVKGLTTIIINTTVNIVQ